MYSCRNIVPTFGLPIGGGTIFDRWIDRGPTFHMSNIIV